ncbi:MAG: hypothetical protein ACR2HI_06620 [Gaiella sp.]
MATLYLHCAICGKKQAHGLISASGWGAAMLPAGSTVDHPAIQGSAIRACPSCVTSDGDWASSAFAAVGLAPL